MIPSRIHSRLPASAPAASSANIDDTALRQAISSGNLDATRSHLKFQRGQVSRESLHAALDMAIRYDDAALADLVLQQGIIAHPTQCRDASDVMRSLFTFARRKHLLYPSGIHSKGRYTELDQALWNHDRDQAMQLLRNRWPTPDLRQIWAAAINGRQLDTLRALLLLQLVDSDRDFRIMEDPIGSLKDKIGDEALRRVLKEVPHHSPKRSVKNFNSREVTCRHLTQYWMARRSGIKFDYGHYRNKDEIPRHVHVSDVDIENMKKLASEVHLVDNRKLGAFIAQQFDAVDRMRQTNRQILMESTNHDMSLELLIKTTKDS